MEHRRKAWAEIHTYKWPHINDILESLRKDEISKGVCIGKEENHLTVESHSPSTERSEIRGGTSTGS